MGDYPREIYLDTDTEERLISYIEDELLNHYAERGPHIEDLLRYQKDYWAKPTKEKATFPFTGAATIVIPLNAIAVETVHARTMTTRFAMPQLVSAHPISPDWDRAAAPFERFFNRELIDVMKIRKPLGDCYLEATKYGTMIGKVGYEKQVRTSIRKIGDVEEEFDIIVKDGAQIDAVSDSRFLMPNGATNPQTAAWCGEEHNATAYEVQMLEMGGQFRPQTIIDGPDADTDISQQSKLRAWVNSRAGVQTGTGGNKFDENQKELENVKPALPKNIDWVELWLSFNVDKDPNNRPKEIVVHYHRDSRTIMSCRYNWHGDLRRAYRTNVYFPVEHRWRGIGICKQGEQFQKEITIQHRQRIDNATLANMRMLKVSKLSGYGPKEPVFPGKMWFLDDMSHIDTLQLGEIYPSSYSNEQATLLYDQQRTGVNEVNMGMPQVGTPGTATSDLARIQEGNKKFDFIYANFNEFTEDIITDAADIIQQFGPRDLAYYDTADNGKLVQAFLQLPASYIRDGLVIELKPSTQQHNKIMDRQNWSQIAPMLTQYYQGLLQLAMMSGAPQLGQMIVMKGMNAATEAMRQILETFDVRNVNRLVVTEIEEMVRNGLQSITPQPGGASQPTNSSQIPGMDNLAQIISGNGNGSNGGANRVLQR